MTNKLKKFQFTLVLKNVDENTPELEDSLYEAGCDDALINFRNGTVYLDFDREAKSFEEAVMSAIKDVESATINAVVANIGPDNYVTASEIASRLNLSRQAVSLWIKGERLNESSFPKPFSKLSQSSPLWKWSDVVKWSFENGIVKEEELVHEARFLEALNVALEERELEEEKIETLHKKDYLFKELKRISHTHSHL